MEENTPLLATAQETRTPIKTRFGPVAVVCVVLSIWTFGQDLHSPLLTQYLYLRAKQEVYGNASEQEAQNTTCFNSSTSGFKLQEEAQQIANTMQMHFTMSKLVFELVMNLVLGSFSDYVGRKMLFIIPCIGSLLKNGILTSIIYWDLDMNYYFIGEVLEAASGSSGLFWIACYIVVSDNTPAKGSRTIGMLVIDIVAAVTAAGASFATGVFIQHTGYFYPSLGAAIIFIIVMVTVYCILPEHIQKKGASCKNLCASVKNVFYTCVLEGSRRKKILYGLAMFTYLCIDLSSQSGNVGSLWELNYPLCWGPEMIGYYGMAGTLLKQIITLPLIRLCQMCVTDEVIVVWSLFVSVVTNVMHAFAYSDWMMYGMSLVGLLSLGSTTVIKAILSRLTSPDRQGSLMAGLSAIGIICEAIGQPLFSYLYNSTVLVMRGATYFAMAAGHLCATIVFLVYAILSRDYYKHLHDELEENVTIHESAKPNQKDDLQDAGVATSSEV